MEYVKVDDIMTEMKGKLVDSGLFRTVTKAAITGAENLFRAIPELSAFPAAIINCPPQTFPTPGAWRELAVEIIIVDEFLADDMERKASSAAALLDGVVTMLTAATPGQSLRLAVGANLTLEDIMAVAVDSMHTAWLAECKVHSPIKH